MSRIHRRNRRHGRRRAERAESRRVDEWLMYLACHRHRSAETGGRWDRFCLWCEYRRTDESAVLNDPSAPVDHVLRVAKIAPRGLLEASPLVPLYMMADPVAWSGVLR